MWDFLKTLFSPSQYMPHGSCYLWQPSLVWLHLTSDLLTAIAYFSIPAILIYCVYRRSDVPFSNIFILFSAFIILCGTGHLLEIWTLWHPAYWLSGVEQAATAIVSCYTALQLVELLPKFLALQTPEQLAVINEALERQIQVSETAKADLHRAYADMEQRVEERTRQLRESEQQLRAIFNAEPECVKIVTSDGVLQNMNPAGLAMIEADSLEQVYGQNVCPMIAPEQQQTFLTFTQQVAKGNPGTLEFEMIGLRGTRRWLESHAVPLGTPGKSITQVLAVTRDITNRKLAEAEIRNLNADLERRVADRTFELQQSNTLLNSFFNAASSAAIGLCIHDKDLRFVKINEALADINGQPVEAHIGRTVAEISPQLAPAIEPVFHHILATGQPILNMEIASDVPDQPGILRHLLASYFPITNETSQIESIGVIVIEISDRKRAEQALQDSQARFAGILEIANDAIISVNTQQRITLFNQGAEKIFGYTAAEILGHPLDMLLPARSVRQYQQHISHFAQSDGYTRPMGDRSEIFGRRKDGSEFPAEASISRLNLKQETVFTAFLRDITNHKQSEAALAQLASIVESSEDAIISTTLEGIVISWNASAERLFGYLAEEMIGAAIMQIIPADRLDKEAQILEKLARGERIQHYETVRLHKDGTLIDIAVTISPINNATGTMIGVSKIAHDITERRAIDQMKTEFISIVSHELRTPLTAIRGSLGLLAAGVYAHKPEKGQRMLQVAAQQSDRLVRLVNDILDLQRLESGKAKLVMQPCNAAMLIQQSVETMRPSADQNQIQLIVKPASVQVWAAPDSIIQTLTNLLSNAIKFSHPGSQIWLAVEVRGAEATPSTIHASQPTDPDRPTPYALFSIQDQGRGIPIDKLETVFERFQQVDTSDAREKGGTGLGLAICRKIIEQHEGTIWVESVLGQGSTFYFTLPLAPKTP